MRGRFDNEVGAKVMPCCSKSPADCNCLWEQRKKVLKQQLLGGNSVPVQQPQPYIPKLRPAGSKGQGV